VNLLARTKSHDDFSGIVDGIRRIEGVSLNF
jgi:hypothetical protein